MRFDDSPNHTQLSCPEAVITGQAKGFKPEFAGPLFALYMDVRWLIAVKAREEEPIRPRDTADSWHSEGSPPSTALQIIPHNKRLGSLQTSKRIIHILSTARRLTNVGLIPDAGDRGPEEG